MGESVNIAPRSAWMGMDPAAQNYEDIQAKLNQYGQQAQQLSAGNALANLNYQKSLNEQPVQADLSPLMALTDAWTGSKFANSYAKPGDNKALLMQLRSELDKNQTGMSEQQVQLLKAQLETQARKEDREAQRDATAAQRETANAIRNQARGDKLNELGNKHFDTARSGYMHDTDELRKKKIELGNLNQTLEEALTNPAAANELAIDRARFTVPSRLSDVEINALGYKSMGDLEQRLNQAFESAKSGTITQENYQAIKDNLALKSKHLDDSLETKAAEHASAYARKTGKAPAEALYDLVGQEYTPDIFNKKKAAPAAAAPAYTPGQVVPGEGGANFKFNGGDWRDKRNWEQVN